MIFSRWHRMLAPLLLSVMLLVTACGGAKEPSRWDNAQQQSTQQKGKVQPANPQGGQGGGGQSGVPDRAPTGKAVAGSKFNKFFPKSGGGYNVVAAQEKTGFAEYKLNKDGKNVAMLSVNDLANNPSALDKFKTSSQKIGGYPAAVQGNTITSVLVGGRYQVKVQSRDTSFTASDREDWLEKFNLNGIAGIK